MGDLSGVPSGVVYAWACGMLLPTSSMMLSSSGVGCSSHSGVCGIGITSDCAKIDDFGICVRPCAPAGLHGCAVGCIAAVNTSFLSSCTSS